MRLGSPLELTATGGRSLIFTWASKLKLTTSYQGQGFSLVVSCSLMTARNRPTCQLHGVEERTDPIAFCRDMVRLRGLPRQERTPNDWEIHSRVAASLCRGESRKQISNTIADDGVLTGLKPRSSICKERNLAS